MFPILWGLLQSIVFTVFSNAGGVGLSKNNNFPPPNKKKYPSKNGQDPNCDSDAAGTMIVSFGRIMTRILELLTTRVLDSTEKILSTLVLALHSNEGNRHIPTENTKNWTQRELCSCGKRVFTVGVSMKSRWSMRQQIL